ncbi:MAG: hypothetical protein IPN29_18965 [Saprospiraceae bacterium]|nr:hypothetical protein [Saprospiraceae bacterium]
MKKQLISYFALLTVPALIILLANGCQKDGEFLLNKNSKQIYNSDLGYNSTPYESSCLNQIEGRQISIRHRSKSMLNYYALINEHPSLIGQGTPNWNGSITEITGADTITMVPLENSQLDSILSIYFHVSGNDSIKYIFHKNSANNIFSTDSFDIHNLFSLYKCYLYCNNNNFSGELRDGDGCYNFGDSWWERFTRGIGKLWRNIVNIIESESGGGSGNGPDNFPPFPVVNLGTINFGSYPAGGSGGGVNSINTNINLTPPINLYIKYIDCLIKNPELNPVISDLIDNYPNNPYEICSILDQVLNNLCLEAGGNGITTSDFNNELNRTLDYILNTNLFNYLNTNFQNQNFFNILLPEVASCSMVANQYEIYSCFELKLEQLFTNKLNSLISDYLLINPVNNQPYTSSELIAGGLVSISCLQESDFETCAIYSLSYNEPTTLEGSENSTVLDPDLWPDCESWEYVPVSQLSYYQSCGVLGIEIDASRQFINEFGDIHFWQIGWSYPTIYFEYPRIRQNGIQISSGEAAFESAKMVRAAEIKMEEKFSEYQNVPFGAAIAKEFEKELRSLIRLKGGNIGRLPRYGNVPINLASYLNLSYGNCQ